MSKEQKREDQTRKGILKSQSSESAPSENRKSAHWNEENIRETRQRGKEDSTQLHVKEPKTPFNSKNGSESPSTSRGGEVSPRVEVDKAKENIQKSIKKVVGEKAVVDIQRKSQANALQGQDTDSDDDEDDGNGEEKPQSEKKEEEKQPGPKGKSSQHKLPQMKTLKKE